MKKGSNHSEESKKKISKTLQGTKRSHETRQKISKAKKGVKLPKVKCPWCGQDGAARIMRRWHFDKCKWNPKNLPHLDKTGGEE